MTIYQKPNSKNWYFDFRLGGYRYGGSTGTPIESRARMIEARERLKAESDQAQGIYPNGKGKKSTEAEELANIKLKAAMEKYIQTHGERLKSYDDVQRRLGYWYAELGEAKLLKDICDADISNYRFKRRGQVADSTLNREIGVLRAFLNYAAQEWGVTTQVKRFPRYSESKGRTRFVSDEEERVILEALTGDQDVHDFVAALLDCGARVGELLKIEISDVRWDIGSRGAINFRSVNNKSSRQRYVPLTERLAEILRRRIAEAVSHGSRRVWFYKQPGNPLSYSLLYAKTEAVFKGLQLKGFGEDVLVLHSMRHTIASRLVQAEASLYTVAALLGHSSIKHTARYSKLTLGSLEAAMEKIQQRK